MKPGRAVFLDRDGVIVEEVHFLRSPEHLRLIPGSAEAIARLKGAGFKVLVASNQSGVARGYLTLRTLARIHRILKAILLKRGARLDAIYYCPHHPRAGRRARCDCRKPRTGMLERAARRFGLDLKSCYLVGDTRRDVRAARNAGCRAILVRTGKGGRGGRYRARPDKICRDLTEAAEWILKSA